MSLAGTVEEIARIQQSRPPVVALPLAHDTLISRAWVNDPIHSYVRPMEHHLIAPTLRGDGVSAVRFGRKELRRRSTTGGVTITPRGFSGDWDCSGRPVASNVYLSAARLQRCADEVDRGRRPELLSRLIFEDRKLFSILTLICAEADDPGLHDALYLERLLDLLCLQLLRGHTAFQLSGERTAKGLRTWQVRRLTHHMQDHLDEAISLQDLADLLGMSRFHLCTAFREATGVTPHRWLVRLRMERARLQLAETRSSITEIALAVGYHTPSAFAHAFRAHFGLCPRAFRRQL